MTLCTKPWERWACGRIPCILLTAPGDCKASQERGSAEVLRVGLFAVTVVSNRESMGTKQPVLLSRVNWTSFSGAQMSVIKHRMPFVGIQ